MHSTGHPSLAVAHLYSTLPQTSATCSAIGLPTLGRSLSLRALTATFNYQAYKIARRYRCEGCVRLKPRKYTA